MTIYDPQPNTIQVYVNKNVQWHLVLLLSYIRTIKQRYISTKLHDNSDSLVANIGHVYRSFLSLINHTP